MEYKKRDQEEKKNEKKAGIRSTLEKFLRCCNIITWVVTLLAFWSVLERGLPLLFPSTPELTDWTPNVTNPRGILLFIHGLHGDSTTWTIGNTNEYWPQEWLAKDFPDVKIYSYTYPNKFYKLFGDFGSLRERAGQMVTKFESDVPFRDTPIIVVTHSMGGLLAKDCYTFSKFRKTPFAAATKAMVFYATPHAGASLAALGTWIGFGLSSNIWVLSPQNPELPFLNSIWQEDLKFLFFAETEITIVAHVVPPLSACPQGIDHAHCVYVPANHLEIVKPAAKDHLSYRKLVGFLNDNSFFPPIIKEAPKKRVDTLETEFKESPENWQLDPNVLLNEITNTLELKPHSKATWHGLQCSGGAVVTTASTEMQKTVTMQITTKEELRDLRIGGSELFSYHANFYNFFNLVTFANIGKHNITISRALIKCTRP